MEVRVEAETGAPLPDGSYIAVRIGDIQKQTLYDPRKVYRFPEARRFGKIDLYSRVGTCDLVWGADQPEARVCKVVTADGDSGTRLKVHVSRPTGAAAKNAAANQIVQGAAADPAVDSPTKPSAKGKDASASAKRYLQEHDVEGILTGAMRALLKAMPEDAPGFLCNYITSRYAAKQEKGPGSKARPVALMTPNMTPKFQSYYRQHVLPMPAAVFFPSFHSRANWPRPERKPQVVSVQHKPSVGTWTNATLNTGSRQFMLVQQNAKIEDLRLKARDVIIKASADGKLDVALTDALYSQNKAAMSLLEIENLRLKARDVIMQASDTGELDKALTEAKRMLLVSASREDIEFFRKQAREVVIKASLEGTLEQALREALAFTNKSQSNAAFMQKPSVGTWCAPRTTNRTILNIDDLRSQACSLFVKASRDGSLQNVLGELLSEDISGRVGRTLEQAFRDGRLEQALKELGIYMSAESGLLQQNACFAMANAAHSGALKPALERAMDPEAQACDALEQGVGNGRLEQSLKQLGKYVSPEVGRLRQNACFAMSNAVHNGTLPQALNEARGFKEVGVLRQEMCSVFLQASQDGSLEKAFKEMQREQNDMKYIQDLRLRACNVFMEACTDGTLSKALTEVKQGRQTEGKILPGAVEQTQLRWSNAPSVGTWMQRRKPERKAAAPDDWRKYPSIGTWLAPNPVRMAEEALASEPKPNFVKCPSVGTWMTPLSKRASIEELRSQAREVFIRACSDGSLANVLSSVPAAR